MIKKRFLFASVALSCVFFSACNKPQEVPSSAVPLFSDLGSHHRAVTTSNETAQKYFDQGLRLIYGFNHDEAEKAFREAIRLDPNFAMAWWGVAYALGPNYNLPMNPERNQQALEAVQKAQSLESNAKDAERGLIAAIATRYSADPKADRAQLDRNYSATMKELHERLPEDNRTSPCSMPNR